MGGGLEGTVTLPFSRCSVAALVETKSSQLHSRKRWALPLLSSLLVSCVLITIALFFSSPGGLHSKLLLLSFSQISSAYADASSGSEQIAEVYVESKLQKPSIVGTFDHQVPRLAYLISGSSGDGESIQRTLRALYHPANRYVLHLDLEAPPAERLALAGAIRDDPVYAGFGNVWVIARANLVTYRGSTMVANTLHAAAILLKEACDWDWFINLSASDYPLVTQDDLLYVLSNLSRHWNFIEHTSDIGWKEYQRAKPVIIDPGLYISEKSDVFWATEKRSVPSAFKLFTGSAWMMLSRKFVDFCLCGWDQLPRSVLMYYANFVSSPEGYFHTVICNSDEFRNTTINHDLHFISWDNPPKQHPHFLTVEDFRAMVDSNAPFTRKFNKEDPRVLDQIDAELLGRDPGRDGGFVPGGWSSLLEMNMTQTGYTFSFHNLVPGRGAERLSKLISGLLSDDGFESMHCL